MDTAQLIGTFNYYVNGPGNQNNYVFSQKDDSVLKGPWLSLWILRFPEFVIINITTPSQLLLQVSTHATLQTALKKKKRPYHAHDLMYLLDGRTSHCITVHEPTEVSCHALKSYIYT